MGAWDKLRMWGPYIQLTQKGNLSQQALACELSYYIDKGDLGACSQEIFEN